MLNVTLMCLLYLFAFFLGRLTHDQSYVPTLFGVGLTFVVGSIIEIVKKVKK